MDATASALAMSPGQLKPRRRMRTSAMVVAQFHSAGVHLALLLGTLDTEAWMLFPPGTPQSDLDAASPISLLHKDFPPTIVFHATADRLFAARSSVVLHEKLVELGVSSELHIYADRDHQFDMAPSMTQATVAATISFLERLVTHREESEAEARQFSFPPARP